MQISSLNNNIRLNSTKSSTNESANNAKTSNQQINKISLNYANAMKSAAFANIKFKGSEIDEESILSIKNAGVVVPNEIYRGSCPDEIDLERLKYAGIKTLIDLRVPRYYFENGVKNLGLNYINIPFDTCDDLDNIKKTYKKISEEIKNCPKPVYIHCEYGSARTGAIVAAHKVFECGIDRQSAINDSVKYGAKAYLTEIILEVLSDR